METILQRAREEFPDARPRIISDNGPQFIAKDFKCGRSGNALDLWAHATQQSVDDAVLDLCQRLGIPQRNWRRHRRGTGKRKP